MMFNKLLRANKFIAGRPPVLFLCCLSLVFFFVHPSAQAARMGIDNYQLQVSFNVTANYVKVLDENSVVEYRIFTNDGSAEIYLALGVTGNHIIRMNREGGSYEMFQSNLFTGDVYAISTTTNPQKLLVFEGY